MATKIIIKNSSVPDKEPDPGALETGELAVNLVDRKLYTKDASDEVFSFSSAGEVPSGGSGDRPTSPNVGDLFYDIDLGHLLFWNGTSWEQLTSETPGSGTDYVKLDDGNVRQVIKSAGLGLSDGTDENITLGADGTIDAQASIISRRDNGNSIVSSKPSGASGDHFTGINNGTDVARIFTDGSAEFSSTVTAPTFSGDLDGNATTATTATNATNATRANSADKLTTARSIALSGDASGSANFDGSANITISTSVSNATNAGSATNATNSTNVNVTADNSSNASRFIAFVANQTGNNGVRTDNTFYFNPSTNGLYCPVIRAGTRFDLESLNTLP